jgi:hypothetical protein
LPTTAEPSAAAAARATATPEPSLSATAAGFAATAVAAGSDEPVVFVDPIDPTLIRVARWGQLDDGELFARARYVDWAVMMKRTWGFDVLRCPRCLRKMRVLATLIDPAAVCKILEHLGVRASPLPRAPPRDPNADQADFGFEAA